MREATAVIRNAKRALRACQRATQGPAAPGDQRPGHPYQAHRTHCGPDPQPPGRGDARVGQPAGQPARSRCSPDPQRTPGQAGRVRLQSPDRRQRRRGHPRPQRRDREPCRRPSVGPRDRTDHPPHRACATCGHRRPRLRRSLRRSATCTTSVSAAWRSRAKANPAPPAASSNTGERSATRSNGAPDREGRINHIKRSYGWNRTELTGINGARTWCGHGVFAHNLVKIGALAA